MARKIYKYDVPLGDEFTVRMPKGAKILCIQNQHDFPRMWAEVDSGQLSELRYFVIQGTGHVMREGNLAYVGTFQIHQGDLVFHVFEVLP